MIGGRDLLRRLKSYADWIYASQLAWYGHRWDDPEKIRRNAKIAGGAVVILPLVIVVILASAVATTLIGTGSGGLIGTVCVVVVCYPIWGVADRYFENHYQQLYDQASRIISNPATGPRKALAQMLGILIAQFALLFIFAAIMRAVFVAMGVVS